MKQFIKFLVSIIVIIIIIFTVYFLMQYSNQYTPSSDISGEKEILEETKNDENDIDFSRNENEEKNDAPNGNFESGNVIMEEISGDEHIIEEIASGDIETKDDSENVNYTLQEIENKVTNIKNIERKNEFIGEPQIFEDSVGLDIIGIKNKDFFTTFNLSELTVTVQTAGTMVYIIPNSDFIDNAQYHYDENGNLILYVRELIGVGGEIRYYYEDGKFLKEEQIIEEGIEIDDEDKLEILQRAKLIYEKYIK